MGVDLHKSIPKSSMNWPCFTAIDFAIYYECVDIVRLLLLFDDHLQSDNGLNRIKNAYKVGNIELVNLLLTRDQLTNSITKIEQISDTHVACMKNDLVYFKDLLFTNPNISNSAIWKSYTPLHLSIEYKHSELIELMLDYGADFNIQNDEGKSALHLAFDLNMKDIVKLFLNKCTNFHQNPVDGDGFSHLHIACIEGEVELVMRLIECGANVDSPVNFSCIYRPGFTSLHFSALFGNVNVLQRLLNYGACYSAVDKDNKSPFDIAISTSCDSRQSKSAFMIMEIILSFHHLHKDRFFNDRGFSRLHMWSINSSARDDKSEVRYFIDEHPSDVNKTVHILNTPWDGYTPLHFALELGNTSLANVLLEKGANILCKAANGDTPLHLALNCSIMPQLPSNLHNFSSIQQNPIGSKGFSFFHVACVAGHKELIEYFLDNGINPDFPSKIEGYEFNDKTPLHFTVQNNSSCAVEVSSLLLRFGANPNARDSELNTPLHYIKGQCHSKVINVLIDHGADVNALNAIFETPLLTLCKNAHNANSEMLQEKLELLLDKGADINITDEKGATPLALTSWNIESHSLLVEILLKHVIKFETVGFYVSKTNQKAYSSLLSRFSNELHFNEISFDELCLAELERMKLTHTNDFMAPYDILFKNLNQLAMMVENQVFQQMIDSYDFRKKYPIYGPMLELQLSKGKSRKLLFSESKKAFNYLISYALPEVCTENILQNLDANNLKNIVAARQPLW
ncbi:hypothetical protein QAD02_022262 [Eretmocerus hayati]|uniref:Uncharacterized protein n=1 Tax=Eretmocerus hayati TaxID=131215 RepID=A0ACC2PSK4_9HYME|nr:hypothetical protein QAD02_022262 [Eretmocerus hayati]